MVGRYNIPHPGRTPEIEALYLVKKAEWAAAAEQRRAAGQEALAKYEAALAKFEDDRQDIIDALGETPTEQAVLAAYRSLGAKNRQLGSVRREIRRTAGHTYADLEAMSLVLTSDWNEGLPPVPGPNHCRGPLDLAQIGGWTRLVPGRTHHTNQDPRE